MKKIICLLIFSLPIIANAQESQLDAFFNKYSGKEGYTSVYITKYMFELFKKVNNAQEDKEFKEAVSHLNSIKLLTVDSLTNAKTHFQFRKELLSVLPKNVYKELMVVKDGKSTVTFLIREENSKISEFVMTVDNPSSPLLIYLQGDITLNKISKLSKTMDVNGFQYLDDVKDTKQ